MTISHIVIIYIANIICYYNLRIKQFINKLMEKNNIIVYFNI